MDKINLPFYYELGMTLRPLIGFENRIVDVPKWEVYLAANNAYNYVVGVLRPTSPGLVISRSRGEALLAALDTVTSWDIQSISETASNVERGAIYQLATAAKAFEPVLLAELQNLPSYIVTKKGAYESVDLVERADIALPPHVRDLLAESVLMDVRESGRCLVYDLPTASGVHMMRATESVTHAYYLKVCKPENPPKEAKTLGYYVKKFREAEDERAHEIAELLNQIKNKHRNNLMHPNVFLTAEEAFTLFEIAKSAIIAMAGHFDEAMSEVDPPSVASAVDPDEDEAA